MNDPWNLTTGQWSDVLLKGVRPESIAGSVLGGPAMPWAEILLRYAVESEHVLDLGSGRGENSAVLALNGRRTTLLDWSVENLMFSEALFKSLNRVGRFCQADMTQTLPFRDDSFDMVFSCGVFEYFTADQIERILDEAFRVSARHVIVMVPNAYSLAYRLGKWYMEKTGGWPWGGEVPSYTLKPRFEAAGHVPTKEFSVAARHSLNFLTMPLGSTARRFFLKLFGEADSSRPSFLRQGYLLIIVGTKPRVRT